GRPVGGATVLAVDFAGRRAFASSDDRGRFRFSTLKPGTYTLEAKTRRHTTTAVATLSVPEGGTSDWRLEVENLGSISGSLIGLLERPGQLTISWSCAGQPAADGAVRDDQTFFIAGAEPGDCWLIVERGQETVATRSLSLAPGEPKEGVELVVEAPPRLSGRLTLPGRDGHQVGGAEIWLTDRRGAVLTATRADWTGVFEISAPVGGEHVLRARLSGSDGVFETAVTLPFEEGKLLWLLREADPKARSPRE
ncbi:MAG: carboxypeptidase-like regulatory domain-containing protein, partial [Acidobacteriota bacterium]